jgi:hypothetical protein
MCRFFYAANCSLAFINLLYIRIRLKKKYHIFILFCCAWISYVNKAYGQISMPNRIQAIQINDRIKLDGVLKEDIWLNAPRISNFTQRELNYNQPVSERTEVAIAYNEQFLYIAVWCYDSIPSGIIAKELRRDFNYTLDDNFMVVIDTYKDQRNGFMFVTNPNGARADLQIFNNGGSTNAFWNAVWDVHTTRTNEGWFAEFEIPWYALKYRNHINDQEWGINFERNIRRKREQVLWQGWSRDNRIERVNQAGTLTGLKNLTHKQFIEIKPYAIGGGQNAPDKKGVLNAGGDINYLLSPTYRLNLTFNTDFAQVEADQQQINITRFPLFFPELREFFLEGDDFFNMGFGGNRIIPFYTRKIGLDNNREPVPIIAGGRLLGKEQNRTIGLMSIQTGATNLQPSTNYTVGSWRQDVGKQSIIGAMSVNRSDHRQWNSTNGINGRYSTARFLGNKNLEIGGAFIKTFDNDSGYQPDAYAYRAFISYPNDRITLFASTQQSPAGFNPASGLQLRTNFREHFAILNLRPRPKHFLKWIRQFEFSPGLLTWTEYNDTKKMQSFEYVIQYAGFETRSGERIAFNYQFIGEGLIRDFSLRNDIVIPRGEYWWRQWGANATTFRGRTLSINTNLTYGNFYKGTAMRSVSDLLWRANKYMNISMRYELNDIELPEGKFKTDLIGSRIEYAINPNIFGSMLTQWNSAQEELNINFRLQVIPKLGADFFFIFNQVYDTRTGSFDPKRGAILGKLIWRFTI